MGWPFLIYFTNLIFEVQIGAKLERNWSKIGAFKRGFEIPSMLKKTKGNYPFLQLLFCWGNSVFYCVDDFDGGSADWTVGETQIAFQK